MHGLARALPPWSAGATGGVSRGPPRLLRPVARAADGRRSEAPSGRTSIPCGAPGCTGCGRRTRAVSTPTRPRSRSRCKGWGCSGAAGPRGPASIPGCAGSAGRRAIFTRRSGGRAAGRSACRSSAGRTVSIGRSGRATPCRWRTGCETTCSCTTSWASTPDRRSPTSSRSSAPSACGRWWSASSRSCGGRFTSSTRSTASTWITRPAAGSRSCASARPWASTIASAASPPSIRPTSRGIGRALSHRAIVAEAKWQGLDNVLVLEDDVVFSRRTADVLAQSLAELREREWRLLSLGASCGDEAFPRASGDRFLQTAQRVDVSARGRLSPHRLRPDPDGGAGHAHGHGALAPDPPGDRPLLCRSASTA